MFSFGMNTRLMPARCAAISFSGSPPMEMCIRDRIRRGASFDTFVKNVKILRGQCPDVQLFMSVVAMRQNIGEAVELVRLAKELGFEEIRFGRLGSNLFLGNEKDELIYYPNYASAMLEKAKWEGEKTRCV